jgi:hypothetical protein
VQRLGLVTACGQQIERASSEQPHAVLRVAHLTAGCELEQPPRRAVGDATGERHLREVVEAVADHELGVARGADEGRDRLRRMLAVGVDYEDGVCADRSLDSCADRGALAALCGLPDELRAELLGERVELFSDVAPRAVVDKHEAVDVREHLANERAVGNVVV